MLSGTPWVVLAAAWWQAWLGAATPSQPQQLPLFGPKHASKSRPNIVFILTDDQDLHMNSLDYVPRIKKHLIDRGTLYTKHFCTTAICVSHPLFYLLPCESLWWLT
jgi:hypothetical protein